MKISGFKPSERRLLILIFSMAMPLQTMAAPEWRHAIQPGMKLFGSVLLGDERGTYWGDRLPPGWVWYEGLERPGADYWKIDQLFPEEKEGTVRLGLSRWNFVNLNLQAGFSEEALALKLAEIEATAVLHFLPIPNLEKARSEWKAMDTSLAPLILEKGSTRLRFAGVGFGILLIRTTSARVLRVLVEHYGGAGLWTIEDISPSLDAPASSARLMAKKISGPWALDLDGDGRPEIAWDPGSADRPSVFAAGQGAKMALVKTFEY